LNKLSALEPAEPVRRYEREHPGELIHIDIKKLGRIGSMGHRITGRQTGVINRHLGIGWEYVHVCIDDASSDEAGQCPRSEGAGHRHRVGSQSVSRRSAMLRSGMIRTSRVVAAGSREPVIAGPTCKGRLGLVTAHRKNRVIEEQADIIAILAQSMRRHMPAGTTSEESYRREQFHAFAGQERTGQTKAAQIRVFDRYGAEQCLIYRACGMGAARKRLGTSAPGERCAFRRRFGKIVPLYAKVRQRRQTLF
jgi:hypothetical protein